MSVFFENPLPIAVVGGVLATMALMVFLARRTGGSLAALAAVIATVVGLVLLERVVVTEREQVEAAVAGVMAAIESNDVAKVLRFVDPGSSVAGDVQALMPSVEVKKARAIGAVEVDLAGTANPPTALSTFRGFLQGIHASSGAQVPYINQRVDVTWIKRGDNWLIDGYTAYYNDQPIDAVSSARANRAVPGK